MSSETTSTTTTTSRLAVLGGPKAVTLPTADRWRKVQREEIDLVVELMERGEISLGHGGIISEFEEAFAAYLSARFCIAVNNGTNGLFSAYFAVGVGPGDEVITPSYTWHATVAPIIHCGAIPVFAEVSPVNLCADPEDIERKITSRTKAIVVTHLWGNPADMDAITDISHRHGIPIIEDASHAHGAEWDGKKVGTIGHVGVFSLQASKPLAGGEAGAVVTNDPEYYDRMIVLGHHGRWFSDVLTADTYKHLSPQGIGFKFRASPIAMAIARVQLKRLDEVNRRRADTWAAYTRGLEECRAVRPIEGLPKAKPGGFYEYRLVYQSDAMGGVPVERFVEALRAEGVPTDHDRYNLAHLHPFFSRRWEFENPGFLDCPQAAGCKLWGKGDLPVTESIHERLLSLPSYTDPEPGLIEQVMSAFAKVTASAEQLA